MAARFLGDALRDAVDERTVLVNVSFAEGLSVMSKPPRPFARFGIPCE